MVNQVFDSLLIRKYNQAVPRYTSYPTVPFWKNEFPVAQWQKTFSERFHTCNAASGISIYIHLPFCESLCTYCGCNKKITTNHSVEEQYLEAIGEEWRLYRGLMREMPVIREIHLGGGTPTFFSPKNLKRLIETITMNNVIHPYYEFSIEGHPNNTTKQHLATLFALGFRRISFGVQDLDPEVQRIINRIQPAENVRQATENARSAGFRSVNFDLIYGLPLQTLYSIEKTIEQVVSLKPDRIAFYSYAHVPWTSRGQRLFDESDLPGAEEKIQLSIKGKEILMANGYRDIGMDHFSLETDGFFLTDEDRDFSRYIRDISCKGQTVFHPRHLPLLEEFCLPALQQLADDGLIELDKTFLKLTAKGHYFIRNVCSCFDLYLQRSGSLSAPKTFSKAI